MVDARTATAADFDNAAQRNAHAFWGWLVVVAITWWFTSHWWALVPGALAILCGVQSIGATRAAAALRKGVYGISNPNNGAPDGNVKNLTDS
ncbi:hypothetical protein U8326_00060 [Tsuneonella sp. CC-YZS046]|uniref:hypothetical protein n=1 Tax=Tsuneonella sp. CC-YZS046 TaxID=3042152 RepID=UPI002D79EBCF|nr:hypothetical protein [Tsuneonella sp. CC-YZS046]WRO66598.1 hypothetical protein U8326_00060 [Tsuneonella sp. CC-YZS046]